MELNRLGSRAPCVTCVSFRFKENLLAAALVALCAVRGPEEMTAEYLSWVTARGKKQ